MKNVSKRNLRTCIHLSQREFEDIIELLYPGATVEPDIDCPCLINVDYIEELEYGDILIDLAYYFDINIISYHAETALDGFYDIWIDYVEK